MAGSGRALASLLAQKRDRERSEAEGLTAMGNALNTAVQTAVQNDERRRYMAEERARADEQLAYDRKWSEEDRRWKQVQADKIHTAKLMDQRRDWALKAAEKTGERITPQMAEEAGYSPGFVELANRVADRRKQEMEYEAQERKETSAANTAQVDYYKSGTESRRAGIARDREESARKNRAQIGEVVKFLFGGGGVDAKTKFVRKEMRELAEVEANLRNEQDALKRRDGYLKTYHSAMEKLRSDGYTLEEVAKENPAYADSLARIAFNAGLKEKSAEILLMTNGQ